MALTLAFLGWSPLAVFAQGCSSGLRPWRNYHVIMWVGDSAYKDHARIPLFFQRLREMGVDTAMVYDDGDTQPLLENHFPYYVENIVNRGLCLKFSSNVKDWNKFISDWAQSGRSESAMVRDYCLDDPQWLSWGRERMKHIAIKNNANEPLAYDIRDELSVTYSANPFDYDFAPLALAGFRDWLRSQYRDLAGLNDEWQTQFKSWAEVKPFTTDQIKNRMASGVAVPRGHPDWPSVEAIKYNCQTARQSLTRWDFAPWADFRTYQDISLARALAAFRSAAHEVDPRTPVGIEGTQMPSAFGGYDLWRLSRALDWVEPYDIGNAREIFGSFMPGCPILTTIFEKDAAHARRRLWHLLLEGDRGCLVWWSEDCIDWKSPDYALTPKAKALAPVLREMRAPLAQLFLRAARVRDPVFIHYSQRSIQVDWLLESTGDGSTWVRRFSSFEAGHNRLARARNAWLKAFQDLGFSPRFISTAQIESGGLNADPTAAALVLPSSYALSDKEAAEISAFLERSNPKGPVRAVFYDGTPGAFDEHGKLRGRGAVEKFFPPSAADATRAVSRLSPSSSMGPGDITGYEKQRLSGRSLADWSHWLEAQLGSLRPEVLINPDTRVRVHRFRVGGATLIAFERNIDYAMSEDLKEAGGNEALEKPVEVEAILARTRHLYDLRRGKYLGRTNRVHFTLDPWQPSLFALTDTQTPVETLVNTLLQQEGLSGAPGSGNP